MVNCTMIRDPRWTAARSFTRSGTLANGGSGSPTYPQPVVSRAAAASAGRVRARRVRDILLYFRSRSSRWVRFQGPEHALDGREDILGLDGLRQVTIHSGSQT